VAAAATGARNGSFLAVGGGAGGGGTAGGRLSAQVGATSVVQYTGGVTATFSIEAQRLFWIIAVAFVAVMVPEGFI
jgi:hypothetical protein